MFQKKYGFLIILWQEVYDWAGAVEDMPLEFYVIPGWNITYPPWEGWHFGRDSGPHKKEYLEAEFV